MIPNRPFPSSKKSHSQNEAKCETFVVKMSFICIIIKNHFHINGFALSLALKVRFFGTWKWPICWLTLWLAVSKTTDCGNFLIFFVLSSTKISFFPFRGAKEEWEKRDSEKQAGEKRTKNTSAREVSSRDEEGGGGGGRGSKGRVIIRDW